MGSISDQDGAEKREDEGRNAELIRYAASEKGDSQEIHVREVLESKRLSGS